MLYTVDAVHSGQYEIVVYGGGDIFKSCPKQSTDIQLLYGTKHLHQKP